MQIKSPVENPTIRVDPMGDGHFMAPRGGRLHRGLDLEVSPGDKVFMPINGKFVRIAYPYGRDLQYQGVFLKGEHFWVKMFYLYPYSKQIGKELRIGDCLGTAQNVALKHGSEMIPHIHMNVMIPPIRAIDHNGHMIGNEIYINPEPLIMR